MKSVFELLQNPAALAQESAILLQRFSPTLKRYSQQRWPQFQQRLQQQLPRLLQLLLQLYGDRYDCYYQLEQLLLQLAKNNAARPEWLHQQDHQLFNTLTHDAGWFLQHDQLGAACYVDLFAKDLSGLRQRLPYLKKLGVTYLHLMPLFKAPQPNSDGGYAVSDYRTVDARLGQMSQLAELAAEFQQQGVRLVLDFVFNHTSDEHAWAEKAKAGQTQFQDYYFIFRDEAQKQAYAPYLREIFPEIRRGCFSWNAALQADVWTTFNSFQWDLNYANPEVFRAMAGEMLFLANQGAAVLRLDALAFVWKEAGTSCENLPKAHLLIQAFNAVARIAAPALQFKSEAIVHPDEVVKYIAPTECQLSYNPLLMALLWNSLATRKTRLLTASLQKRFAIDPQCAWVNYIRCHDDIGWTFDDELSWQLGINPDHHRQFLNKYYTGQFDGSFATGVAFQQNPLTGDCRVAGQLASLAGLEQAVLLQNQQLEQAAINRIMLLHAIIFSIGGLPLLYLGDELGLTNDYSYLQDAAKKDDSRWVNRVAVHDDTLAQAEQADTLAGQIYQRLQLLIQKRQQLSLLGTGHTRILAGNNPHLLVFVREQADAALWVLANFSEQPQPQSLAALGMPHSVYQDQLTGRQLTDQVITLAPYQVLWLQQQS